MGHLHTEKYNIFGEEIEWEFQVSVASTSLDLIAAIKHDIAWYGKGIRGYNKRIIMGCLNDITLGWRDGVESLNPKKLPPQNRSATTSSCSPSDKLYG